MRCEHHTCSLLQHCEACKEAMPADCPVVYADRAGYTRQWHPACFVCCQCAEPLVDLIYFWKNGAAWCGRHYCESLRPRCAGCDEVGTRGLATACLGLIGRHHSVLGRGNANRGGEGGGGGHTHVSVVYNPAPGVLQLFSCHYGAGVAETSSGLFVPQIIFSEDYQQAEGMAWHKKHFTCLECETQLTGKAFSLDKGSLRCATCSRSKRL